MTYAVIPVAAANPRDATTLVSIVHLKPLVEGVVGLGALILALHPPQLHPRLHHHHLHLHHLAM